MSIIADIVQVATFAGFSIASIAAGGAIIVGVFTGVPLFWLIVGGTVVFACVIHATRKRTMSTQAESSQNHVGEMLISTGMESAQGDPVSYYNHLTDRIELRRLADLCANDPEFSRCIPRLWMKEVQLREQYDQDDALSMRIHPDENKHECGDLVMTMNARMLFEFLAKNGTLAMVDAYGAPYIPSRATSIKDIRGYVSRQVFEEFCDLRGLPMPSFLATKF